MLGWAHTNVVTIVQAIGLLQNEQDLDARAE